eukprot:7124967-Ditylum_brightwellii.AAC.1
MEFVKTFIIWFTNNLSQNWVREVCLNVVHHTYGGHLATKSGGVNAIVKVLIMSIKSSDQQCN